MNECESLLGVVVLMYSLVVAALRRYCVMSGRVLGSASLQPPGVWRSCEALAVLVDDEVVLKSLFKDSSL